MVQLPGGDDCDDDLSLHEAYCTVSLNGCEWLIDDAPVLVFVAVARRD